jgi:hypothetical protein
MGLFTKDIKSIFSRWDGIRVCPSHHYFPGVVTMKRAAAMRLPVLFSASKRSLRHVKESFPISDLRLLGHAFRRLTAATCRH